MEPQYGGVVDVDPQKSKNSLSYTTSWTERRSHARQRSGKQTFWCHAYGAAVATSPGPAHAPSNPKAGPGRAARSSWALSPLLHGSAATAGEPCNRNEKGWSSIVSGPGKPYAMDGRPSLVLPLLKLKVSTAPVPAQSQSVE